MLRRLRCIHRLLPLHDLSVAGAGNAPAKEVDGKPTNETVSAKNTRVAAYNLR
jgi:hypothetical protein